MPPSMTDKEHIAYLLKRCAEHATAANYYRAELAKAHTLLGRVIQQLSERWDTVNLTEYFPTSNLHRQRSVGNPSGEKR